MCLAVPGKIVSVSGDDDPLTRMAKVDFGGVIKEVCLAYVPEAAVGDYVIVHVGFALNKLDEREALRVLEDLRSLGMGQNDEAPSTGHQAPGTQHGTEH